MQFHAVEPNRKFHPLIHKWTFYTGSPIIQDVSPNLIH